MLVGHFEVVVGLVGRLESEKDERVTKYEDLALLSISLKRWIVLLHVSLMNADMNYVEYLHCCDSVKIMNNYPLTNSPAT